ncbi:unnamed protein product [Cladocopium goreaui]|uniref:Alpha-amylase n=1 Tax=Cladocopium goreaui TaxID=2562237 RepID=A0A9P1CK16_9DINO|nr:unnamed protein product [Cladocopium goreaui]
MVDASPITKSMTKRRKLKTKKMEMISVPGMGNAAGTAEQNFLSLRRAHQITQLPQRRCEIWKCQRRAVLLESATSTESKEVFSQLCEYDEPVAGPRGQERRRQAGFRGQRFGEQN